jgi:hypothetical protein
MKFLGGYRSSRQTPQHGQLSGVSHGIGERSLEKNFGSHIAEFRSDLDMSRDIGEDFMEVGDSGGEIGKFRWTVAAADE